MFHLNGNDFQQHCNNIGQYLRELRLKRDLSTVDVEIICDQMQTDFLHSSVGAVHSNYIRTAVNSLGINKLQQNLENTLEALAEQNDYIICCINIATNPECSVSSIVRGIICEKFVATMHTLLDTDIQKLTLNAVTALVASPCTKSKEKIDAVNFALQWLKNPAHLRFLDVVLESLYIEALRSNQLIALVQHLRRLYQELPKSLLAPFHIYLCDEEIVVGSEPKKFTESSSAAVSNSCADVNETESKCKSTEFEEMIDVKLSTSSSVKIKKMPNFEELIKIYQPINRNIQELTDVYQPTNTDNQELTGAHTFVSNDFAEYQQISNLSAKR
ncbi:unnamed protein product [Onchocerca ochengi]|uniref:BACK domain-containing protein n=1 Tax=Onchocerca ochengi TaxID=42157 RepID=A0A182EH67_ONCOC|nr:unnamed protein product [Onchocerca ochengi]